MAIIDNGMLWRQFERSIDSFGDALRKCPDSLWQKQLWKDEPDQWVMQGFSSFWYLCYHTLFWLDLYLTGAEEGFCPPEPFDLVEMEDGEVIPRIYSKEELLRYFEICQKRSHDTIINLSPEKAERMCGFPWGTVPYGELMLYVMRHVDEHAAQLHLFLTQQAEQDQQRTQL